MRRTATAAAAAASTAVWWLLLPALLLSAPQQVVGAGSSKVACDYSNRLCQWNASYVKGAAVLGDLAFFHGGLYSNDASTPVNGSFLEVMDLRTMSPYVIQVESNRELNSTRYKHHLVAWNDQLLAVGGSVDDANGKSRNVLNVIALDLNTRSWRSIRNFTAGASGTFVFDAADVSGDFLLVAFQVRDASKPSRQYLALDLNSLEIEANYQLAEGAKILDWPLIGIMSLTGDGSKPHLVLQAQRQMATASNANANWFVIDGNKTSQPLPWTAVTKLPKRPGGVGGNVLALNILQIGGTPKLVLLSTTTAVFRGSPQARNVTAVTVHDIKVKGLSSVSLQLTHVLLTPPLGIQLADVRSVDLPMYGSVGVSAADVTLLPYVGRLELISSLDGGNANIQQAPGGFIVRGSGRAEQVCQQGATWQPFVVKASFAQQGPPIVVAVSNNTWCQTRSQQTTAATIASNAADLRTNTKLFKVKNEAGTQLLLLNAQRAVSGGGELFSNDKKAPLMGAFINLNRSTVENFTIKPATSYKYPVALSSCTTSLGGRTVYVETGGVDQQALPKGVFVMDTAYTTEQHNLLAAAGGDAVPGRAQAALACSPDGKLFLFGGLVDGGQGTQWKPTNELYMYQLAGGVGAPRVTKHGEVTKASPQPAARSGHAMVYLTPSVASKLGMQQGALLLYGGSDVPATDVGLHTLELNETETAAKLRNTNWDTATWLFDLAASKWVKLRTDGDQPPGLMYHSMEALGDQVVMFGGQMFNASATTVRLSTSLYALDFSSTTPRWRHALISLNNQGAFQLDYPSTGVVLLPEFGAVALKHRAGVNLAPIPQSLEFTGDKGMMSSWGLNTINTTAGDWVRLAPSSSRLSLQQPVLVASDILVSGVSPSGSDGKPAGRHLLQQQSSNRLVLECQNDTESGTAVNIRSAGAQLSNMVITGCTSTAINIQVDATGAYTTPAVLSNVDITGNEGIKGSALFIGPAASATLQYVSIIGNVGPIGVVYAGERSSLTMVNCTLSDNIGSAVTFAGSKLDVVGTSFTDNSAVTKGATPPEPDQPRALDAGGALRLMCFETGPGGYDSVASIRNSTFTNNRGINGGAVYAGGGTTLSLQSVVFTNNRGFDGGGVFADRDACLQSMVNTTFRRNSAQERGGAVKMHNPSCNQVSWKGGLFSNNTAADGGALYLTEVTTRSINGSAVYEFNTATRPFTARSSTSTTGGAGGAIYLGLWGTNVLLYNSMFFNNSASNVGGAINVLAIDRSSLALRSISATGNAANMAVGSDDEEFIANTLRSEGGVLHVTGSDASVTITDSSLNNNRAGRGGAVSMNSARGNLLLNNTVFSSNEAWTAGGAVAVTERKSVLITESAFSDNRLWWQELAAGGGFYCFLCNTVNISSSSFTRNRAAYGGGAAVLQPWQPSVISNTSFIDNVALPDPSGSLPLPAADKRRRSLLAVDDPGDFSGSMAVQPQRMAGLAAAAAILGPLGANVTGDNGYYTGGGGLYVSLSSTMTLQDCAFLSNSAYNGGGFLARTDACMGSAASASGSSSGCSLQLSQVSVRNNTARAAGGALITSIRPEVVRLEGCSEGEALNRDTLSCLEAPNALLKQVSSSGAGRSLLQAGSAAGPNAAVSGYGNLLLTSASSMKCQNMVRITDGEEWWLDDDCNNPIRAPPGLPFGRSFMLLDGLGDPIRSGIYDARMPMSAVADSKGVSYRIFGNTTQAQNGVARFTGLTVNGKPGDTVRLTFRTQNGLTITRDVIMRECQAGEYTDTSASAPNEQSFRCAPCQSPQFSFYPKANSCSQCASLPVDSFAVCNLAALVPADGFYQSHPRSPVLSRCISSLACRRSDETRKGMANWAYANSNLSTLNMTQTAIASYMERMCATGYTGPLCGACQPDHGHSGSTCVKCPNKSFNSFLYIVVCCFMLLVPVVQMVLHSKNVSKNTQLVQAATRMPGAAVFPWMAAPSFQARNSATSSYTPGLPPLTEGPSHSPTTADALREYPSPAGKDVAAAVEMAYMQQRPPAEAAPGATTPDLGTISRDQSTASIDMLSPFSEPSAISGAMAVSRDHLASSAAVATAPPGDMQQQVGMQPSQNLAAVTDSSLRSATLFQRLFDVNSLDHEEFYTWSVGHVSQQQRRVLGHNTSSISHRGVSGTSVGAGASMSSMVGRTPSPAPEQSLGGAMLGGAAGGPAFGQESTAYAGAAGGGVGAGGGAAAGGGGGGVLRHVHRRAYKFWHADIISMMVNYMQLLGLLRLVRINWAEQLSMMLTYLDLTSGATTWMSVECSMRDEGGVPRSVKRSVVVLLWPLAALTALGCFWALAAFVLRTRKWARRPVFFRRWLMQHVVMSVVILLYFLYTTTTREIISLFSCQQVDDPVRLPQEAYGDLPRSPENPLYQEALVALPYQSSSWLYGYWTSDTNVRCGSAAHIGLVVGLGVPGVLFFALGLPIGLWVLLWRISKQQVDGRNRLEEQEVELQFGPVYDKYRYSCYYWECIILLEAFLLTLMLVMLQTQNNAALQVLVAMAIIFLEAVLHITFQPYACRMLDTLRRLAVYGLMSTLFLLMLVTLSQSQDHERLVLACMIIVAFINIGVISVHLWATGREVKRWLLWMAGKGPDEKLTLRDLKLAMPDSLRGQRWLPCAGRKPSADKQSAAGGTKRWGRAAAAGAGATAGAAGGGPPKETVDGVVTSDQQVAKETAGGPAEEGPARPGVVVVVNPTSSGGVPGSQSAAASSQAPPGWLWRRQKPDAGQ